MFEAFTYGYTNARIRAMKSFLLKKNKMIDIAMSKTLEEFVTKLDDTLYSKGLRTLKTLTIDEIEIFFLSDLMTYYRKVLSIAPKHAKGFIETYTRISEINALKSIINSKFGPVEGVEKYDIFVSSKIKYMWDDMLNSKDINDLINLLMTTPYGKILKSVEKRDSFHLNLSMDRYYFEDLWNSIKTLSKKDKQVATEFVGLEIDIINILNALRACKIRENVSNEILIPIGFHLKPKELTKCSSIEDVISFCGYYSNIMKKALKKFEETSSLHVFEKMLKSIILERSRSVFSGPSFHIGILLGFLKMKEAEIQTLRGIALSIDNGLGEEDREDIIYI